MVGLVEWVETCVEKWVGRVGGLVEWVESVYF